MIRSQAHGKTTKLVQEFKQAGMLRRIEVLREEAAEVVETESVYYVTVPKSAASAMGRFVMSYVTIDKGGYGRPVAGTPRLYAVVERPTEALGTAGEIRLRECHVLAEDLALRRGILTPYGRSDAESIIARQFAGGFYAENYIPDRIAHLEALRGEYTASFKPTENQHKAGTELTRAIDTLQALEFPAE